MNIDFTSLSPAGLQLYKISSDLFSSNTLSECPEIEQKITNFLQTSLPAFNSRDCTLLETLKQKLIILHWENTKLNDLVNRICNVVPRIQDDLLSLLPSEMLSYHIFLYPPYKNSISISKVNLYYRNLFKRAEFLHLFAYNRLKKEGLTPLNSVLLQAHEDVYVYLLEGTPLLLAACNFMTRNAQRRWVHAVRGFRSFDPGIGLTFIVDYLGIRFGPFCCSLDGKCLLDIRRRVNVDTVEWNEMNEKSIDQQLLDLGFKELLCYTISEQRYYFRTIGGNDQDPPRVFLVVCDKNNNVLNILTTFHATLHGELIKAIKSEGELPSFIFEDQQQTRTLVQFKKFENNIVEYLTVICKTL